MESDREEHPVASCLHTQDTPCPLLTTTRIYACPGLKITMPSPAQAYFTTGKQHIPLMKDLLEAGLILL